MTDQMQLFGETREAGEVRKSAVLSENGVYRYQLERFWGPGRSVLWVMLNPSTADADVDDRTIGRVIDFTKAWGFDAAKVCNLFALRATDPKALASHADPVGPANDAYLQRAVVESSLIVAAWGAHPFATRRARTVAGLIRGAQCLGVTKDGHPRHPLYVAAGTDRQPWGVA